MPHDGCGVDQNVEAAQRLNHLLGKTACGFCIGEIGGEPGRSAPLPNDLLLQVPGSFPGSVMMDGDSHPALGKRQRHCAPKAPPCARHQGNPAAQIHYTRAAPAGAMGTSSPVVSVVGLARDITPSVISCISTYRAPCSPAAATLSTVRTMAGATALTRTRRSCSS